jgi:bifunctional DNA-binding transcriptional regulator/antitoxin component of YhaV-PrlF toxin-antitoxin module
MARATFISKVLEDGHLSLPSAVKKELHLKKGDKITAEIRKEIKIQDSTAKLLELAGSWKDRRSPEKIIEEITHNRKSSFRLRDGL